MRRAATPLLALVLLAAAAAGCGGSGSTATTTAVPATTQSPLGTGADPAATTMAPADTTPPDTGPGGEAGSRLALVTPAFEDGGRIPVEYTCDGDNAVPEVRFDAVPPGTMSLALTVVDPDGGDWIHWAAWNIPPESGGLAAGTPAGGLPDGTRQGANDYEGVFDPGDAFPGGGEVRIDGWDGPCPPGGEHRYVFTLYAITRTIDLPSGAPGTSLLAAIEEARTDGSLIAEATITGSYASG